MAVLIKNNGLGGKLKISGASTGGFKAIISSGIDADAQAFFDRVSNAGGGILSALEQNAIITLVTSLKSAGLWNAMKAIYPMVGASAAACAQNLKSALFTGTFAGSWVYSNTGILTNGSNTFMNTGFNTATNMAKTSAHLSVYVRASIVNSGYDLGNSSDGGATSNATYLIPKYSNNAAYFGIADNSYATTNASVNALGFWCGATNNSSTQILYKNGISNISGTAGAGSLANNNIYLGANNGNGTAHLFTTREYTFVSIGDGLGSINVFDFYTAIQAFQTTLNRQV